AAAYAQQAIQICEVGRKALPAEKEEWQPLGVFALVRGEEETSDKVFQLAVNKQGVIRGNYYDAFADSTLPVYGSVDREVQRAAWVFGASWPTTVGPPPLPPGRATTRQPQPPRQPRPAGYAWLEIRGTIPLGLSHYSSGAMRTRGGP